MKFKHYTHIILTIFYIFAFGSIVYFIYGITRGGLSMLGSFGYTIIANIISFFSLYVYTHKRQISSQFNLKDERIIVLKNERSKFLRYFTFPFFFNTCMPFFFIIPIPGNLVSFNNIPGVLAFTIVYLSIPIMFDYLFIQNLFKKVKE